MNAFWRVFFLCVFSLSLLLPNISEAHKTKAHKGKAAAIKTVKKPATKGYLTTKQQAMFNEFTSCIRYSTAENPIERVKEFVFHAQGVREQSGRRSAFRGSVMHHGHEICLGQAYGLKSFRSLVEIMVGAQSGVLVSVDSTYPYVEIAENEIPADRHFARPWARDYILTLGKAMYTAFPDKAVEGLSALRVTSMIRSMEDQARQVRRGRSPADCRYRFLCSTHTTGSSFDIGKRDLNTDEYIWLQKKLANDQRAQKIFFIIERSHFHVFVLPPKYMGEE